MIKLPSIDQLFAAGVHFGHQKYRSAAQARQFVFQVRDGVMILDLEQTSQRLKQAAEFLRQATAQGKLILVVGTKRQLKDLVGSFARQLGLPFITQRWPGGMLTNFETMKRRIAKYNELVSQTLSAGGESLTKKERRVLLSRTEKMGKLFEGIRTLERLPDALLVISATTEGTAIAEARRLDIPIVALADTDANPALVSYPVPANDDSRASIELILSVFYQAITEGQRAAKDDRSDKKTKRANRRAV